MTLLVTLEPADAPFGWAPRSLIEDDRLSWKAKGLWLYLNSRPPGWRVHMNDLIRRATDGEAAIRTGIRELRDFGWMDVRRRVSEDTGRVEAWDWVLLIPDGENRDVVQMAKIDHVDSPDVEDRARSKKKGSEKKVRSSGHPSDDPLARVPQDVHAMTGDELIQGGNGAIAARFMPRIRQLRLHQKIDGFSEGQEVSVVRALLELEVPPGEIEDAIDGVCLLRDHGAIDWLPKGKPGTMRVLYNTRQGKTPLLPQAAHYARKRADMSAGRREQLAS